MDAHAVLRTAELLRASLRAVARPVSGADASAPDTGEQTKELLLQSWNEEGDGEESRGYVEQRVYLTGLSSGKLYKDV